MSERPTAPIERYRRIGLSERLVRHLRALPLGTLPRRWLKQAYYRSVMLQTLGRGMAATLPGGEVVRFVPEYRYLSWNPDEYNAFRRALSPGDVALDIGANVGAYTLLLAQWVRPGGEVHAFEPAPQPFKGLVRHLELNGLSDCVHAVRAAVADTDDPVQLVVADTAGQSRIAADRDGKTGTITVPATSVDRYCAKHGISPAFVKIDVEGFELQVLRGARETIRKGRDRLALFVEMHPGVWPSLGIDRADILEEIRRQGLTIVPLTPVADVWAVDGICVRLQAQDPA